MFEYNGDTFQTLSEVDGGLFVKVVMKPVEMLAWFVCKGRPKPLRFRFLQGGAYQTVKMGRVVHETEERVAGKRMIVYRCQSLIQGAEKVYELKYEIDTCTWYLHKI